MMAKTTLKNWMPAIASAGVLAIVYFFMFAPERDRRTAIEQHILMVARSIHTQDCRLAMIAKGLDEGSFTSAGGYVRYEQFEGGLHMALNAVFVDELRNPIFCTVSLAPGARVDVWQPDEF